MSRIPCLNRSKSLHNVRPSYMTRGRRPRTNACRQASPTVFRQGFQGQQRQYSPSEFGLSPNEQFQDAQIFRNLDYNTDRAAFEQFQGPVRPAYQPPGAPRLSGLTNECLDEMSFPSSNNSARVGAASQRQSPQMDSDCIDDVSAPSILKSLSSGVISCLDEISAISRGNGSYLADASMGRGGASGSFRPGPQSPLPDECIADVSAPSNQSQGMDDGDCINNISAPQNEQAQEGSAVESIYANVLERFEALKRRMARERGEQQADPQNDCIAGAGKTTTTQIDTNGGDIIKETVVQRSIIENGELQKTTKHIVTRRDACGNETSECNECKETSAAPPQGLGMELANQPISPHHQTPCCGDPFMLRLTCNVKKRLDFEIPGEITKEPCPPCEEELGDESAPLFAQSLSYSLPSSRRSLSLPSQQLGEMSGPSFASSLPSSVGPECVDDISAPSLEMGSPISPLRVFKRMPSLPSQQLSDMSAPSFERSMPSPAQSQPSQQICDMAAPSFRESFPSPSQQERLVDVSSPALGRSMSMRSSPRQRSQPSPQICDMPARSPGQAPFFSGSFPSPMQQECLPERVSPLARSMSMRSSPRQRSQPSPQICDMPARSPARSPSFRNQFASTFQQECLDDISAPSFGRSMSMRSSPRVRSLPSDQICDMASPSFGSSLPSSVGADCLDDISAPSLEMGSPISPLRVFKRMPSLPSQQLSDMSAPSFERSMPSPAPSPEECFDAPSPARSMSMRSSPRQRSQQSQQICDMPAPSPAQAQSPSPFFSGSFPSPMQQECQPEGVSPLARSMSMRSSPRQRSQPSPQICDMPARSPARSPSFRNQFASTFQQECLDDISAPSFGRSMSMRSSPRVRSLPSDQICDMASPSFGSSLPSSVGADCLDDISAPSLEMGSPISPLRVFKRMPSLPSQQLSDMSAPSFERSMPSPAPSQPSQQICDMAAPSFRGSFPSPCQQERLVDVSSPALGRSMSMRSSPRQRSQPSPQICDMPARSPARAPFFSGSFPSPMQQECQPESVSPRQRSQHSQQICDMPARSPARSPAPVQARPPSFRDQFASTFQQECIDDISAPSFGRSMSMRSSPRVRSLPSDQICDMASPSFGSSLPSSVGADCLDDISAPSLEMGSPISPLRVFKRMPSLPSQQLSDMSAPSFERSMPSPAPSPEECFDAPSPARSMSMRSSPRQRSQPSQQICDMPAASPAQPQPQSPSPFFSGSFPSPMQQQCLPGVSPLARSMSMRSSPRQRSQPSPQICDMPARSPARAQARSPSFRDQFASTFQQECIDDISAPSFGRSMSMRSSPRVRSLPSDQICDLSEPSFGSSLPSSIRPEFLSDESAPSLEMGSPISPLRVFRRMPSMPSEQISDMSSPVFTASGPEECSENIGSSAGMMKTPGASNYAQHTSLSLPSQFNFDGTLTGSYDNYPMSCPSYGDRSLPSIFGSQSGPGMSPGRYAQYADVSLPSTFDSPMRGPRTPLGPEPTELNEPFHYEPAPLPNNSYKETIEVSASVHSIATRTVEDNRNISEISQPSFATMESSNQSTRSNANQSSLRGFDTMANYMPFEEQMRRSPPPQQRLPNFDITNPFDETGSFFDSGCPQGNATFNGQLSGNMASNQNRNRTM